MLRSHRVGVSYSPRGGSSSTHTGTSKRKRVDPPAGVYQRLLDRQIDSAVRRTFVKRSSRERFSNFSHRLGLDMYAQPGPSAPDLEMLMTQRHRIQELCAADGLVFGLTENGICACFDMATGHRICILNRDHNEVVRSLFHNKYNGTLIAVAVFAADSFSCLRCRASQLSALKQGVRDQATELFPSESLRWPGFVEFDDVNGKVLTFSADLSTYKVWSMADPTVVLYAFSDAQVPEGISEIKISPGIMLLVSDHTKAENHLPLRLLSIEDGTTLRSLKQPIKKDRDIEVIDQFNEKLLLKQQGSNLLIVDLLTSRVVKLKDSHFRTPAAFIFLYENQTFLAFKDSTVTIWNFKGELVSAFEDHKLCLPIPDMEHTSIIYVTHSQDIIISLCDDGDDGSSIHVSNILSGKCLARIDQHAAKHDRSHITALCYSEDSGDIITGNELGRIQVWSN